MQKQALDEEDGFNLNRPEFIDIMNLYLEILNSPYAKPFFQKKGDKIMEKILSFKEKYPEFFEISYEEVKGMINDFQTKLSKPDYKNAFDMLFGNFYYEQKA